MCLIPCRVKPDYKTHPLTIFFFPYHIVLFGIPLIYIFFRFNLCRNIGFGVHNAITRVGAMVAPQLVFAVSIQLYLHTYLLPFIRMRQKLHTGALQEKRKEANPIL